MAKKYLIYIVFLAFGLVAFTQINAQTGTNTRERTKETERKQAAEQKKAFREENKRDENKDKKAERTKQTSATGTNGLIERTRIKTLTIEERRIANNIDPKNECAEYRVKILTKEEIEELKEKREGRREEKCVKYSVKLGEKELQKFREKIKDSEEKNEERRAEMEKRIAEKREEMEDKITKKREELKKRLLTIKEEHKRKRIEKLDKHFEKLNKRLTDHYFKVLVKIEKILNKTAARADKAEAHGYDVSSVRTAINNAKNAINASREAVVTQAGKIYSIEIENEETLKDDIIETRKRLHNDLKNTRLTVKTAHDAARKAAVALAQIPKVDELEIEDETE